MYDMIIKIATNAEFRTFISATTKRLYISYGWATEGADINIAYFENNIYIFTFLCRLLGYTHLWKHVCSRLSHCFYAKMPIRSDYLDVMHIWYKGRMLVNGFLSIAKSAKFLSQFFFLPT